MDHNGKVTRKLWLLSVVALIAPLAGMGNAAASRPTSPSPIRITIALAHTRVIGGTSIKGEVVVTNTTPRSITVRTCTDGWLQVGLVSKKIHFSSGLQSGMCQPPPVLHPGRNRFAVIVYTTYQTCGLGKHPPFGEPSPPCAITAWFGVPPLPSGKYAAKIFVYGLTPGSFTSPSISVTLLPGGRPRF
jgi:hypothetical protein